MTYTKKQQPVFPKKSTKNLQVKLEEGKTKEEKMAELCLSPFATNAHTATLFAQGTFGEVGLGESITVVQNHAKKIRSCDLSDLENTLAAQVLVLNVMFNELARRAAMNMGSHMDATEKYLKLALKAQSQCRTTAETLAEIKNPSQPTFIKQANIAGQQQVNNGSLRDDPMTHAQGKNIESSNELLTEANHETLDSRGTTATIRANSQLATVGALNRSNDSSRQSENRG